MASSWYKHTCSSLLLIQMIVACEIMVWPLRTHAILMAPADETGSGPGAPLGKQKGTLRQGTLALASGDLKAAEKAFQEALQQDPKQSDAHLGLAEIAMRKKNPDAAKKHLEQAREIKTNDVGIETAWGRLHILSQKYPEAVEAFQRAIKADRAAIIPRLDLADLYLATLKEPQAAADLYRDVLSVQPNHAGAHYGLGIAMADLGSLDTAQKEWEESSRLAPANPSSAFALARLHASKKNFDAALSQYEAALNADKSFVQALIGRGDVWVAKGNEGQALTEYEQALKLHPDLAAAYERIGMLQQKRKNWPEAERAYLAVIRLAAQSPIAYNNLAWVKMAQKGGEEDALRWATKAAALAPQSSQTQDTLGWAYRATGNKSKSLEALQHAISLEPKSPEILSHLGIVQAEAGLKKEAVTSLRKALELGTDFPGADEARAQLSALEK